MNLYLLFLKAQNRNEVICRYKRRGTTASKPPDGEPPVAPAEQKRRGRPPTRRATVSASPEPPALMAPAAAAEPQSSSANQPKKQLTRRVNLAGKKQSSLEPLAAPQILEESSENQASASDATPGGGAPLPSVTSADQPQLVEPATDQPATEQQAPSDGSPANMEEPVIVVANPPPEDLLNVSLHRIEALSSIDVGDEVVFEGAAPTVLGRTLEEMEQGESNLIQFEEIQKLYVTNVDGTKVPKMNYFDELAKFNESQKKEDKAEDQFYRFMFRWTEHERNVGFKNPAYVVECLERQGQLKDYAFQLERGEETQKLHYQGFVTFLEKKRARTLGRNLNLSLFGVRMEPARASDVACKDYVTKEETRVKGPFVKLNLDKSKFPEIAPIIDSPYPWQKEIMSKLEGPISHREIMWVYDAVGNSGKTMLCKYIVLKNQGTSNLAYYLGYGKA